MRNDLAFRISTSHGHKLRFSVISTCLWRESRLYQPGSPTVSLDARQKHSGMTDKSATDVRAQCRILHLASYITHHTVRSL